MGRPGGTLARVQAGDYGVVRIRKGEHKGQIGNYDDDDLGRGHRPGKAIVYLGEPFESDYIVVSRKDLEKVDVKSIDLERWKRKCPWLVKLVDLP
jgi:hypothetical protein